MNKLNRVFIIGISTLIALLATAVSGFLLDDWIPVAQYAGMGVVLVCSFSIAHMALRERSNKQSTLPEAERIARWLNELHKYPKGTAYLHQWDKYCCLGVAQELMGSSRTNAQCLLGPNDWFYLGLKGSSGEFNIKVHVNDKACQSLAEMNDFPFKSDRDFTRMRKAMLLTMHHWVQSEAVLEELESVFGTEIKKLRKQHEVDLNTYVI